MTKIPALLIDDEAIAGDHFRRLAERASRQLSEKHEVWLSLDMESAVGYRDGLKKVSTGIYPIVVVDLALADPEAEGWHHEPRFPGLELVVAAHKNNKHVLAAVYTAYATEAMTSMFSAKVDYLLDKTDSEEMLLASICDLVLTASRRFNYRIDLDLERAYKHAFGETIAKNTKDAWEICLRRLMRSTQTGVRYEPIRRGRSGAGVVAAFADDFLPTVLKWDTYENLRDEADKYDQYVSHYIPFRATTSQDDFALAGEAAILAYSFVGMAHDPTTLAKAILREDPEDVANAIEAHFKTNCKRWFARSGAERPYDLALRCCDRLFREPKARRDSYDHPSVQETMERTATRLGTTKEVLVSTLERLIDRLKDSSVHCKPETIVHGDLNAHNLVWDHGTLWMIDFAKTGVGPRIFDFAKLEASLKRDVEPPAEWKSLPVAERVEATLRLEDILVSEFRLDNGKLPDGLSDFLLRIAEAIRAIRRCASAECGPDPALEYFVVLFLHTVKHLEYLVRDAKAGREFEVPLMTALFSAYRLAKWLEEESDRR